tara:strand:- start:9045 stop:9365 length:321 start_codon:yes stop_codon:yes gene_type:complete
MNPIILFSIALLFLTVSISVLLYCDKAARAYVQRQLFISKHGCKPEDFFNESLMVGNTDTNIEEQITDTDNDSNEAQNSNLTFTYNVILAYAISVIGLLSFSLILN